MNNEIKEILDYFRTYATIKEANMIKKVYDYITNLQEQLNQASLDIQELTERDIWCPSNCDKLTNLQEKLEEQKRIEKESLDKILDLEDTIVDKKECIEALEISFTNLQEENERLKEVIENLTTMTICGDKKQIKNTAQFKLDQLRSKIDKAIYWIDEYCIKECEEGDIKAELRYVKDILKGEDNE